jgi:hypothetical protein
VNLLLQNIDLYSNEIDARGASALAEALKVNTSVTQINLRANEIGTEGALVLAEALKVNAALRNIDLCWNKFGAEGALAFAEALQVNSSVTHIALVYNLSSAEGVLALVEALKVNTSEIEIDLFDDFGELMARNKRLRHLFLFDARNMLLSVLCADECGVVWPYLFGADHAEFSDVCKASIVNVDNIRAEFAAIVEERSRRAATPGLLCVKLQLILLT